MRTYALQFISIVCLSFFFGPSTGQAKDEQSQKHLEVSLRMIGHQVLLQSNDSTSVVSPIVENEGRFRIEFDAEFGFIPEDLVAVVDSVVKVTGIAERYILEVVECDSSYVVYSFEMDNIVQSNIVPCKSRRLPEACYALVFTLTEENAATALPLVESSPNQVSNGESNLITYFIGGLIGLLALGILFLWNRRKTSSTDPNVIPIGAYQFDKRNTALLIEDQKIELTGKEADLLLLLYNDANSTVERDVILNRVWGDEGDYVGRTLDVFISKLRKKLEFDSQVKIVNIRGVGYKLVLDV